MLVASVLTESVEASTKELAAIMMKLLKMGKN